MRLNHRIQKYLSVLVAVLLLFTALPLGVFAESGSTDISAKIRHPRTVTVEHPEHGTVVVMAPLQVYDGDTVQFTVTPEDGYVLGTAICNSENVTARMVGNTYTHTVFGDVTFSVSFMVRLACSVTFSGAEIRAQTVDTGDKVAKPADPTRVGYTFGGWYSDEDCRQAWNFEQDTVIGNMTLYAKWIANAVQKAAIRGRVTEENHGSVPNATVELCQGTVKLAATVTDGDGNYSFDSVENGIYDIVVTKKEDGKIKTELVTVNTTGGYSVDVELPDSNVSSLVEHQGTEAADAKSDISQTVVGGLDAIASSHAQAGENVKVKLIVEPKADTDTKEQRAIKQEAGADRKVEFLDLSLWKQVNNGDAQSIGDANTQLLTIVIPFDFTNVNVSSIKIIRQHGGVTSVFGDASHKNASGEYAEIDEAAGTITLHAMKFSDYAIAYRETNQEPEPPIPHGDESYPTTVNPTKNGTVTLDKQSATVGETVTVTVQPDSGYMPGIFTVFDAHGKEVEVRSLGGNRYSFRMPDGGVTVSVTFRKAPCPQDETCVYAKFTDADPKAWYHDGVHYCVAQKYMQGISETEFAPDATTTRAMIVTLLWRMEGEPFVNYAMSFRDVEADRWYTDAIRWAQAIGIVIGYSPDTFGTDDPITREQMATIMYRYAKYHKINVANTNTLAGYTDVKKVSAWALDAMKWANATDLVQGRTTTTLVPELSITRAEVAAMIQRYCEKIR